MNPEFKLANEKSFQSQEKHEKFLSFFNLNEYELAELKERITKAKGTIRMFVHPFFDSLEPFSPLTTPKNTFLGPGAIFTRLINLSDDKTPPQFILEEHGSTKLEKMTKGIVNQKLYIIDTQPSSGVLHPDEALPSEISKLCPKFEGNRYYSNDKDYKLQYNKEQKIYEQKVFDFLAEKLKSLGVEKVLIGGMYLWIHDFRRESLDINSDFLDGCLFSPIKNLSKYLQVELSNFNKSGYNESQGNKFKKAFGKSVGPEQHMIQ
ncbi:MAG: hypothetical protein V4439_00945 [Patescibacteria group bacterium]